MSEGKVRSLDLQRFKDKQLSEIEFPILIEVLVSVIESHLEPRINVEVRKAIAPLEAEIVRLRESLNRVSEHVEKVRMGDAEEAGLILTDDVDAADIELAKAKVDQEQRYPFSTVNIASQIPGKPSTTRIATVIKGLNMKGDPKYWCEIKVGATTFNRYSRAAVERLQATFRDPREHLPEDSPAFRTVIDFLEGTG